jgi:DNA-binding MarR family transcriptional regulator
MKHKHTTLAVMAVLADGQAHTAASLIRDTDVSHSTVYEILQRMTKDGCLDRVPIAGSNARTYEVTPRGRRVIEHALRVAGQAEGSRSSNPTASRSSS